MVRDLSPASWLAPGTATIDLGILLAAVTGTLPLPLDEWLSNYSPSIDVTVTTAVTTFQAIATLVPGLDSNARFVLIMMPRGNTTAATIKGVTDTGTAAGNGIPINPNGFAFIALSSALATWGIYTAAAIVGVRIIVI